MRDDRLKRGMLACLVLACALAAFSPAAAAEQMESGTVQLPWLGPSGEDINQATQQEGLFGYSIAIPALWVGKHFELRYLNSNQVLLDDPAPTTYGTDLDVYFFSAAGWTQPDGTVRHWNNTEGVEPGPESGNIPAGSNSAFVVISSPTAHDVLFDFVVTV